MYGGADTHIPLRVNTAGVIPIIFAQSLIMPAERRWRGFVPPEQPLVAGRAQWFIAHGTCVYVIVYALIIIFFTYFYTAVVLNPKDLAENMRSTAASSRASGPGGRPPSTSTGCCRASRCRARSSWR